MASEDWGSIYRELGATPIINAIGSLTLLGGSVPVPEVREAMDRADSAYIPLMELQEKVGAAVAEMTDVPAAYVTSGAGSALTLATAAVMAGDDDDRTQQLPDTTGMKSSSRHGSGTGTTGAWSWPAPSWSTSGAPMAPPRRTWRPPLAPTRQRWCTTPPSSTRTPKPSPSRTH